MNAGELRQAYAEMMRTFYDEPLLFTDIRTGERGTAEHFEAKRRERLAVAVAEEALPDNVIYLPVRHIEEDIQEQAA